MTIHVRIRTAALVLSLFALCSAVQAQINYTGVVTDQGILESATAEPLVLLSMGGVAVATASSLDLSASDSTHWVGGPYVNATRRFQFGVAGDLGTYETIYATVAISSAFGNDLNADFVASHGFNVSLSGNAGGVSYIGGGLVEVNCLGCGGHLGGGTVSTSSGSTVAWLNAYQTTLTLSTVVERGWNTGGSFEMYGYLGVGSTWADMSIDLLSITDSQGRALALGSDGFLQPVPEPGTLALWLAGLGVLGAVGRRARA
jgi:hypothetical protein